MAKWRYDLAGSSAHIHLSLWDEKGATPLFHDAKAEHGMSALMRAFVAGQLALRARHHLFPGALHQLLQALPGRHLRADQDGVEPRQPYRRLPPVRGGQQGHPHRVPHRRRRPQSVPGVRGADRGGPAGVEEKLELEPPFTGDAYGGKMLPEVPKTLREATGCLADSQWLREAFGDAVVEHYVHTARWEQFEYDRRITDWELMRGFERY